MIELTKDRLSIGKPTIREKKTGKSKRLYFPRKTREKLYRYAARSANEYIFYSSRSESGHITRQAVWKEFKRAAKKANVNVNVGTHTMRKNYSYKLWNKSHDLKKLQGKLNHSKTADSLLYLI